MATRIHLSQSVEGPLMNWKKADWKRATKWMTRNNGTRYTADELKMEFIDLLAKGNRVIPIGDCDNFDPQKGCLGHPIPDEPTAATA